MNKLSAQSETTIALAATESTDVERSAGRWRSVLALGALAAASFSGELIVPAGPAAADQPKVQAVESSAIVGGNLQINGHDFLPIMSWDQCPPQVDENIQIGVNTFMASVCSYPAMAGQPEAIARDEQALINAIDSRAYTVVNFGSSLPGSYIIGEYGPDEPDNYVILPSSIPKQPSGTTEPYFLTFSNHFAADQQPLTAGTGIYPQYLSRLGANGLVGFDDYYWNRFGCRNNQWINPSTIYEDQRELVALANHQPTYQWIEVNRIDADACPEPVNPARVQAEIWLAIAGGAKGLGFFTHSWASGSWQRFNVAPDVAATVRVNVDKIQSLSNILLEGQRLPAMVTGGDDNPVKAGAWVYKDQIMIVAVNSSEVQQTTDISLPDIGNGVAQVMDEQRALPVAEDTISDTFQPLQTHIYVYYP